MIININSFATNKTNRIKNKNIGFVIHNIKLNIFSIIDVNFIVKYFGNLTMNTFIEFHKN